MSFGGGGGGAGGSITAHKHNAQAGEGGPLQLRNSTTNGTTVQFNGGAEVVAEVLL